MSSSNSLACAMVDVSSGKSRSSKELARGEPVVEPVFRFRPREGGAGRFSASGMIPALLDGLQQRGEDVGEELFAVGEDAR